jgi:hypothetical protein
MMREGAIMSNATVATRRPGEKPSIYEPEDRFYLPVHPDDQPAVRGPSSLVLAMMVAAAPAAARAEVVVGEGVPFTAAELEDALAARTDGAAPLDVQVSADSAEQLRLTTPGGTWEVAVGGARGPSAARLVALFVIEPAAAPAIAPPSGAPETFAPIAVGRGVTVDAPRSVSRTWWVTFGTGAARGAQSDDLVAVAASLELATARGPWLAAVEISLQASQPSDAGAGEPVRTTLTQVRAAGGVRVGSVELLAGPIAGTIFLDNVPSRRSATMLGVGTAARWRHVLGDGRWSLQGGVGVDGYRHRIVVSADDQRIASTPRVALSAIAGLSVVL